MCGARQFCRPGAADEPTTRRIDCAWVWLCAPPWPLASLPQLCGRSPLETDTGRASNRHRHGRAGDRAAIAARYRIVLTRMSSGPETRNYGRRRTAEGLTKGGIQRCLKRSVAQQMLKPRPRAA